MAAVERVQERWSNQAVEEEVVVVSHGGVVEDRRHLRALGVLDQQFSGFGVRVDGVYTASASEYSPVLTQLITPPIRPRGCRRAVAPCVNRLSLSTSRVWYWVQAKSNASGDINSGMPFSL